MAVLPEGLIVQAGKSKGAGYEWGANGPLTFDCSGYVRYVYAARNAPFPDGTRTAEQIRQYCVPVGWDDVQPGDLLFIDYEADRGEPLAADGHVATHVGISLGVGSRRAWHAGPSGVALAVLQNNPWWQTGMLEARRHPSVPATPLPTTAERVFTLAELLPVIEQWAVEYSVDPKVVAAMCWQESGGRNWRVHHDGTGHGLFGLDDGGGLIEFERWSGLEYGRGPEAGMIAPALQIEFACCWLSRRTDVGAATREWHRGPTYRDDQRGYAYQASIEGLVRTLFG